MNTNYLSMINFFVPLIADMQTRDSPCTIVHINSLASFFGLPMQGDYTAAKGAARLFLETARMELTHRGISHISLQTVYPGFVDTHSGESGGIPTPGQISSAAAAMYVLKGIQSSRPEIFFPPSLAFATKLGRILPYSIRSRILLSKIPREY